MGWVLGITGVIMFITGVAMSDASYSIRGYAIYLALLGLVFVAGGIVIAVITIVRTLIAL